MLTKEDAAAQLDGNEYRKEGSPELFALMEEAGLVAVFGASDDLMEFRGAVDDEIGCYDGGYAYVTSEGLAQNKCDNDECPYHKEELRHAVAIEAVWSGEGDDPAWVYVTDIPHATFTIMEDDEPYCKGIVFALAEVTP